MLIIETKNLDCLISFAIRGSNIQHCYYFGWCLIDIQFTFHYCSRCFLSTAFCTDLISFSLFCSDSSTNWRWRTTSSRSPHPCPWTPNLPWHLSPSVRTSLYGELLSNTHAPTLHTTWSLPCSLAGTNACSLSLSLCTNESSLMLPSSTPSTPSPTPTSTTSRSPSCSLWNYLCWWMRTDLPTTMLQAPQERTTKENLAQTLRLSQSSLSCK